MRRVGQIILCIFVMWLSQACGQSDTLYCNLPAHLVVNNAYQASALYTACTSMGEFCTVCASSDGKKLEFHGSKVTSQLNINQIDAYKGYYLGLSGLIIGLPTIPEMGKDVCTVVCFDRACANCYEEYNFCKQLAMQTGGFALCGSCGRTYNLNDCGRVSKGEAGRPLYRYRTSYVGNTLVVSN